MLKIGRLVDIKLLENLRGKPCIICRTPGVAHHIKSVGARGDDALYNLMLLCNRHHVQVHTKGLTYMVVKYPVVNAWLKENNWQYDSFMEKWIHLGPEGLEDENPSDDT